MSLNTTTNLSLSIIAKSRNTSTSVTGLAIPQKLVVNANPIGYGNISISDGKITVNNTTTVSTSRANVGTSKETSTFTTSSIIPYNKKVAIATVTVTPSSNFKIAQTPSINVASGNSSGLQVSIKKTSTTNVFNIVCESSREINAIDNVVLDLNYLITKTSTTSTTTIKKFYSGSDTVHHEGETREIRIYGSPNTPFDLFVLDSNDNSIITTSNTTTVTPVGMKPSLSLTLNNKGYYSTKQKFPGLPVILNTKINGSMAASGATKIIFDSLSGVQVGDQLFIMDANSRRFSGSEPIKVLTLNPDGDNANECTFSKSVTAADNKVAIFKRSTTYKINLETTGTKDSSITSTFPTQTLNQYTNPVVTFNATTSNGSISINGGAGGVTDSTSFGGKVNQKNKKIKLTYTLTGKTFTQASNKPVPGDVVLTTGSVGFNVTNIQATGASTATYKLFIDVNIVDFGNSDSTLTINLDNIIS
tara:strand:- start:524 stop:1948 length:1425 start_codon:yes stop_codon:yes gene_type:complete